MRDVGTKLFELEPGDRVRLRLEGKNYIEAIADGGELRVRCFDGVLNVMPVVTNEARVRLEPWAPDGEESESDGRPD